ncbi:MAG: hypothetical protein GX575_17135 [Candidatus Anammoximicrobium sp.]|nr:hypothetical protein [Candidatus Anammoximicrobium sp.]
MSVRSFAATCECAVAAHGVIAAPLNVLPALREQPGDSVRRPIPPRFLRHSDEQTVVGLAAVLKAMHAGPLRETCFDNWGVVAAPRFPGRLGGAATFRKYGQGGPAAISPHIIPQNSLHSVSSAISISLAMHGPNFGIGGGPEALAEGLTVAMTLLDSSDLPGLWLVLTQWSPEPVPDGLGSTQTETVCLAVALGMLRHAKQNSAGQDPEGVTLRLTVPPRLDRSGRQVRLVSAAADPAGQTGAAEEPPERSGVPPLVELARWLAGKPGERSAPWSLGLPWGGRVELARTNDFQQTKAA